MSAITFDTLSFAKKLKTVGFTEDQAEVLAKSQSEIIENTIATKQDLKKNETALGMKIETGLANTKAEIIKWVAGMLVVQVAVGVTLFKLLS